MIKGIILDYGGTLDTGGDHWSRVIQDGWIKAGVVADEALFREAYVFGERELERTESILPSHDFNDVLEIKINLELQFLAQNGHFPPAMVEEKAKEIASYCYSVAKENTQKAKVVITELSQKYPLVLVSNFYGNIETVLKEFELYDCFKKIIESAKVGVRKPDTKIFELGVKVLGFKPEEVLVIGDSLKNDIEPAKRLGCQVLLLEGRGWGDIVTPEEAKTLKRLDEVIGYLEGAQLN